MDDPGYLRISALDGLVPFGHDDEPVVEAETERNGISIPDGWETAVSRSTGKTYFINTVTVRQLAWSRAALTTLVV
eukprot:SAG11_NODE_1844_length_4178_cov_4.716842_2_plen_76_part_00